jgi:hypothetical protein
MIKKNERLDILHDDNGSFVDFTKELSRFKRGTASISYVAAEDSLYIGFYKPINCFYVDLTTANTNDVSLTLEYFNGSFNAPDGLIDDTDGFQRSGFVMWERNQKNTSGDLDEIKTTINSVEKYWYKLDFSGDTSAMVVNAINILFSTDEDLKNELYEINQYLPSGEGTHLLTHVACRDEIIQTLNLQGKTKDNNETGWKEDISAFDLLDISEVRLASTYLALAKIMFNVSDQIDDSYLQKSQIYRSKYNDIINQMTIRVDHNDDGLYDRPERENVIRGTIRRE